MTASGGMQCSITYGPLSMKAQKIRITEFADVKVAERSEYLAENGDGRFEKICFKPDGVALEYRVESDADGDGLVDSVEFQRWVEAGYGNDPFKYDIRPSLAPDEIGTIKTQPLAEEVEPYLKKLKALAESIPALRVSH